MSAMELKPGIENQIMTVNLSKTGQSLSKRETNININPKV